MIKHFNDYLVSDSLLRFSVAIIGLGSIVVALYFIWFQPQFRFFAWSMLLLGLIESSTAFISYSRVVDEMPQKMQAFEDEIDLQIEEQRFEMNRVLRSFFWLKLLYGGSVLALTIILSRLSMPSWLSGVLIALMLHAGLATVADSFGEQYTRRFRQKLDEAIIGTNQKL